MRNLIGNDFVPVESRLAGVSSIRRTSSVSGMLSCMQKAVRACDLQSNAKEYAKPCITAIYHIQMLVVPRSSLACRKSVWQKDGAFAAPCHKVKDSYYPTR